MHVGYWSVSFVLLYMYIHVCYACDLFQGHSIEYTGDPLNDFTLLRFLDQFMHKNPKKPKGDKGGSLMQPIVNSRPYTLPS